MEALSEGGNLLGHAIRVLPHERVTPPPAQSLGPRSRFGVGESCHGQNAMRMLYSHLVSSLRDGPGGVRVPLVVFFDLECLAISGCEFRSGLQDRFRGVRTVGTRTW